MRPDASDLTLGTHEWTHEGSGADANHSHLRPTINELRLYVYSLGITLLICDARLDSAWMTRIVKLSAPSSIPDDTGLKSQC